MWDSTYTDLANQSLLPHNLDQLFGEDEPTNEGDDIFGDDEPTNEHDIFD